MTQRGVVYTIVCCMQGKEANRYQVSGRIKYEKIVMWWSRRVVLVLREGVSIKRHTTDIPKPTSMNAVPKNPSHFFLFERKNV